MSRIDLPTSGTLQPTPAVLQRRASPSVNKIVAEVSEDFPMGRHESCPA